MCITFIIIPFYTSKNNRRGKKQEFSTVEINQPEAGFSRCSRSTSASDRGVKNSKTVDRRKVIHKIRRCAKTGKESGEKSVE